jgi:hypothetical protein
MRQQAIFIGRCTTPWCPLKPNSVMERFANELYARMKQELQISAIQSESILQKSEASIRITDNAIRDLKEFIVVYNFKDTDEEVKFFKTIKPQFLSERIFHLHIFQIESHLPIGGKEVLRNYYQNVISNISAYFEQHRLLYVYYRTGRADHDDKVFIRTPQSGIFNDHYTLDMDNRFSTPYGQRLAKIQAYERVCDYLLTMMEQLDNNTSVLREDVANGLVWTDSNTALTELIYSLHARGAINHGKVTMKQIAMKFEKTFNVRLGNIYQTIKDMRLRKKVRTVYLHNLIDSTEKKMDDTDMDF